MIIFRHENDTSLFACSSISFLVKVVLLCGGLGYHFFNLLYNFLISWCQFAQKKS